MKTFSTIPPKTENVKEIKCPLCNNVSYNKYWTLENFAYSKCPNCSLIYQNPQPLSSDVEERYDDEYFGYEIDNEDSFLNLMLLGLKDMKFDVNKPTTELKQILDIGCATGLFLSHMKDLGWKTYGVEVCESAADYGNRNRGVNIFKGILENAPIKEGTLDVIHLSHVIEHINSPNSFVEHIFKLLKPGGVVYCTTPNVDGLQAKLFKNMWRSAIPDHMILFSVKTLKQIFFQNKFDVTAHKTWGGLCANSGYPKLIKRVLDKLAKPLGFGDVVIIKAIKPLSMNT